MPPVPVLSVSASRSCGRRRVVVRTAAATVAAALAVALPAASAAAHVTVSSPDAQPGGYGKIVLRVPNEENAARTIKVSVSLPQATPFASVSTKPHPGWTAEVGRARLPKPVKTSGFTLTEAPRTVTWTARSGGGIEPGQFDEFEIAVGPLPSGVRSLTLPAVQTYSNGTVVRWAEPAGSEGDEPEHPAPTLRLAATTDKATQVSQPASARNAAEPGDDWVARGIGIAGLAAALVALGVAIVAARRRSGLL